MIVIVALGVRLLAVRTLTDHPSKDALQYHRIALNQLAGHGHALEPGKPTTLRPPVYPLFLAGIYALTKADYQQGLYGQAVINALLVIPLYFLGYRMSGRASVGILAALLFAVHTSFEIVTRLYRENIIVVLVVLLLWCLYEGFRDRKIGRFLAAGGLCGLLGLTNPVFMPLGPVLLGFGLLHTKFRNLLKPLALQALVAVILITPWLIRNQMIPDTGQKSLMIRTIYFSYYPAFSGQWWWPVADMDKLEKIRKQANDFLSDQAVNRDFQSELREKLLSNPAGVTKLILSRVIILWASPPVGSSVAKSCSPFLALLALGLQYCFVLVSLITMVLKLPNRPELFGFAAMAVYLTGVYALTHAVRRYGYPLVPHICLFFSWGVLDLLQHLKTRKNEI